MQKKIEALDCLPQLYQTMCSNCDCSLAQVAEIFTCDIESASSCTTIQCCSNACYIAKQKEWVTLECNKLLHSQQEMLEEYHDCDGTERQLLEFVTLLLISIRDSKNYLELKEQFASFLVDMMEEEETSEDLLLVAKIAKTQMHNFDMFYEIMSQRI